MKQVGYYHVFPFQDVEKGSSIVIWGMGEVGKHYIKQVLQTGYCNIEYAVDKKWKERQAGTVKVMPIYAVRRSSKDICIVIASEKKKAVEEIREQLLSWGISDHCIVWNDIVIDESMVVSEETTQCEPVVKRIGYYHIFPFQKIDKDENIILWGMGEVGRHYSLQLKKTGYAHVEYAVDSNWMGIKNAPVEVYAPKKISKKENSRIIIANGSVADVDSIKEKLKIIGIAEDNIVWDDIIIEEELVVKEKAKQHEVGKPYLYGSESEFSQRLTPYTYAFILCTYDVITFSVFDVLVFRSLNNKNRIYELIGEKLGVNNFLEIRNEAEKEAKKRHEKIEIGEPSLRSIYNIIEEKTGVESNYGCEMEIAVELEWCRPNGFFKEVYKALIRDSKKVLFLEDTYYSKEMIYRILIKCGYCTNIENIYTSSECYTTKKDGSMFQLVKNVLGEEKKFIHVGFSTVADIKQSRSKGFMTQSYPRIDDIGNKFRVKEMSEFVGEAYRYVVNKELHQYGRSLSVPYEYGFIYGGILALGFLSYVKRKTSMLSVEKMLFLSSDGEILKDIYQNILRCNNGKLFYWSEIAGLYMLTKNQRKKFLDEVLYKVNWDNNKITIKEYFKRLGLDSLLNQKLEFPVDIHVEMNEKVTNVVGKYLVANWKIVEEILVSKSRAAFEYIHTVIQDNDHIGIVDVNGNGENAQFLINILKSTGHDCRVDVFTVGCKITSFSNVHAYCFDRGKQRFLYLTHFLSSKGLNSILYSLFWSKKEPDIVCWDLKNDEIIFNYATPVIENHYVTSEIQSGIFNFCKNYYNNFGEYEALMNISGWDAYRPFKIIAETGLREGYYKKFFGGYIMQKNITSEWNENIRLEEILN